MKYAGKQLMCLLLLVLAWGLPAAAGKHPVPLPKDVEDKNCIECHEDKTKGKSVHSAIALGCLQCHEVRNNKDTTRVKLTTTTPVALCVGCHADKNATKIKGKLHPPAVRECVKCHDPHSSNNKNQLLKPTAGDKQENLCLSCHEIGVSVPKDGSRHVALDMGCDTCHVIHKTGDPGKPEFAYHLTKSTPQLCLDCHDPKDGSLQKAHDNQPFATTDCVQCHDPHQSNRPSLMQAFVHAPFEGGKSSCSTCHEPPKDGKIVLTQGSVKELCITCHSDIAEQIKNAKVQHPGAVGDCTDCHNPHAGKSPGFPKPDAVNVCLTCHIERAGEQKENNLHQPAFEQGCAVCHMPHGSNNPQLLRASSVNALCLECHGPDASPQKLDSGVITIFNGKVTLPGDYFATVPVLPLTYNVGHPTDRHPISDTVDLKTKKVIPMTCLTCHQPHASNGPALLVKDKSPDMAFCRSCHQEGTLQGLQRLPNSTGEK